MDNQERNRQEQDDMKGTQSDSTRTGNRQAPSHADRENDRRSNESGEDQMGVEDGTHAEGQYSKQSNKPTVQK